MRTKGSRTLFEIKKDMLIHLMQHNKSGPFGMWDATESKIHKPTDYGIPYSRWDPIGVEEACLVVYELNSEYERSITDLIVAFCMSSDPNKPQKVAEKFEIDTRKFEITVTINETKDGAVSRVWNLLGDMMGIVDRFEPEKADGSPFMWIASAQEEAVEVSKEASKMARKIDETKGYHRMMKTLDSPEHIFGELIKEVLDLMVVLGTGIQSLERDFEFQTKYDIKSFCIDYVIWKTARAMGIASMRPVLDIKLSDYRIM